MALSERKKSQICTEKLVFTQEKLVFTQDGSSLYITYINHLRDKTPGIIIIIQYTGKYCPTWVVDNTKGKKTLQLACNTENTD